MPNTTISCHMTLERVTKRKYRFYESDPQGVAIPHSDVQVGTLYLDQKLFPTRPSTVKLNLTISPVE